MTHGQTKIKVNFFLQCVLGGTKLYNEEGCDFKFSSNIIQKITGIRIRWAGNVERMSGRETRVCYEETLRKAPTCKT